jgi:hypothetical protein
VKLLASLVAVSLLAGPVFAQNREVDANIYVNGQPVTALNPLPITGLAGGGGGGSVQLQLRSALSVWTDLGYCAGCLNMPIQGTVSITGSVAVTGGLTDAQLRASGVAVTGTFWQATQPVSGTLGRSWTLASGTDSVAISGSISNTSFNVGNFPSTYDTSDRAARLLGIVYGEQGQLAQRTTTRDLFMQLRTGGAEYDARQIRTITETLVTKGAGAVVAESLAVRCVNAAGNAFESCAGAGGPGGGTVAIDQTGTANDVEVTNSSIAVTGTFWQATQPVSGTFWQATQPVSGPVTDAQLRATAVPVSGTFWQATQPVSGPLTDAQLRATAVPVSGFPTTAASTAVAVRCVNTAGNAFEACGGSSSGGGATATAAAPTYLEGAAAALSVDLSGGLRVETKYGGAHSSVTPADAAMTGGYAEAEAAALDSSGVVEGDITRNKSDIEGRQFMRTDHPNSFFCAMTSTAVAATVITGCVGAGGATMASPGAGLRRYITDISYNSSIISTTANFMQLSYGTGATCATGNVPFYRGSNSVAFLTVTEPIVTPIRTGVATDVCFIHPGAGTRQINIRGYVAP